MTEETKKLIQDSEQFAIATSGPEGLNVVPLSVVELVSDEIHICNFFMNKTLENLGRNPEASLACWKGLAGVQLKGTCVIEAEGDLFLEADERMKVRFPERTLKSVIRFMPQATYSVTPGDDGKMLS